METSESESPLSSSLDSIMDIHLLSNLYKVESNNAKGFSDITNPHKHEPLYLFFAHVNDRKTEDYKNKENGIVVTTTITANTAFTEPSSIATNPIKNAPSSATADVGLICSSGSGVSKDQLLDLAARYIHNDEKDSCLRYRLEADQRMALMSRVLQRLIIASHITASTGSNNKSNIASTANTNLCVPKHIKILRSKDSGNRPVWIQGYDFKDVPFIHFNVTHDNELVAFVCSNELCGVDSMKIQLRPNYANRGASEFFKSMRSQFSEKEWRYIKAFGDEEVQLERFMRLWTMKEAFVKTIATGLYVEPLRLDCVIPPDGSDKGPSIHMDNQHLPEFAFKFVEIKDRYGGRYIVCVCTGPHYKAHDLYRNFIPKELVIASKAKAAIPKPQLIIKEVDIDMLMQIQYDVDTAKF